MSKAFALITLLLTFSLAAVRALPQDSNNALVQQGDRLLAQGGKQLDGKDYRAALESLQAANRTYYRIQVPPGNKDYLKGVLMRISRTLAFGSVALKGLDDPQAEGMARKALELGERAGDQLAIHAARSVLAGNQAAPGANSPSSTRSDETDKCLESCKHYSVFETGQSLDCIDRCTGEKNRGWAAREDREQEARESRHQNETNDHNAQCQREYDAAIARGVDADSAAARHRLCVRY